MAYEAPKAPTGGSYLYSIIRSIFSDNLKDLNRTVLNGQWVIGWQ